MKLKNKIPKNSKGFTLVEILVVIAIIATLAGISIPIGLRVYNSAKDAETKALMKQFIVGADAFYKDHNSLTNGTRINMKVFPNADELIWTSGVKDKQLNASNFSASQASGGGQNYFIALGGGHSILGGNAPTDTNKNYIKIADHVNFKSGMVRNPNPSFGWVHGMVDSRGYAMVLLFDFDYDNKYNSSATEMGDFKGEPINLGSSHFGLISIGRDGALGGGDDLASWQ